MLIFPLFSLACLRHTSGDLEMSLHPSVEGILFSVFDKASLWKQTKYLKMSGWNPLEVQTKGVLG